MVFQLPAHETGHLGNKCIFAEPFRVGSYELWREPVFECFKSQHRFGHRIGRLPIEKDSCSPLWTRSVTLKSDDSLSRAAFADRNHRPPTRLRLDGHHSKILFSWEQQRAAARILLSHFFVAECSQELHRPPSETLQPFVFLSRPNDPQAPPQSVAHLNR